MFNPPSTVDVKFTFKDESTHLPFLFGFSNEKSGCGGGKGGRERKDNLDNAMALISINRSNQV